MIILKHKTTGELASADTQIDAEMMCLKGYRQLKDDEKRQLDAAPPAAAHASEPGGATTGAAAPPPKTGAGSGRTAWADYAAAHQVTVADDASRDDIVSAVAAAGVRTE